MECAKLDPAEEPQKNEPQKHNIFFKAIWFLGGLFITVIGSYFAAFFVVKMFVFGGQQSAWGYEYLLCMFAPLPGVIGFLIAWFLLIHKFEGYERDILSALIGVAVACIAILAL